MEDEPEASDSKFPLWLWLLMVVAIAIAFVSAHIFYGNVWLGFAIILAELAIAAMHFGVCYAWKYFFD